MTIKCERLFPVVTRIKYRVFKNDKFDHCTYSLSHGDDLEQTFAVKSQEYTNPINPKKNLDKIISRDLNFYKNTALNNLKIEVYINNQLLKTIEYAHI